MPAETTRVALVTGGARGIGAAIARRLAADGFAVGVLDLDEDSCQETVTAIEAVGGRAVAVGVDVADETLVTSAVARVAETLGPPTVLINNAGLTRDNLLFKMPVEDWDLVLSVHLRGPFLMTKAVQGFMTEAGWGRIVNLSSTSGIGNRGQANYAAAKAGIVGFTKTMAIELGRFGVTVNAIAPGFIETDMTVATAARIGVPFEEFKTSVAKTIPVARTGTPDDVATAASFFVRDDCGFVSGQLIYVAGGPVG